MTEHTPGPWEVVSKTEYIQVEPGVHEPDFDYLQIRQLETGRIVATLDMHPPDGELIAAVPDMLEVLQIIFNRVMYESPTAEIGAIFDAVMIERVEDVLNKAKGGR